MYKPNFALIPTLALSLLTIGLAPVAPAQTTYRDIALDCGG